MEDPKEVAEHVMLIDLARNDVGRVVSFGTEVVDEVMVVERYSHIMHLTSQVSGTLAPGKGPIDVLRATLPAGTLSGAPKVRAMQIIDDLEPTKRGVYGGVVGYLDFSGNLDTAIAIRTMTVMPDGRASVQAGAGIVADSDPASENAECAHKAAAVLAAVAMARTAAGAGAGMTGAEALPQAGTAARVVGPRRGDGYRSRRHLLPPGPVQSGPRRPRYRGLRRSPSCSARRERSTPTSGSPARRRSPSCSTPTPGAGRTYWPVSSGSNCGWPSSSNRSTGRASHYGARRPGHRVPHRPAPAPWSLRRSTGRDGPGSTCSGPLPADDPELDGWLPVGAVRCDAEAWEAARIEAGCARSAGVR